MNAAYYQFIISRPLYVRLNIGLFDRYVMFVIIIYIIACIYEMKDISVNVHLI